MEKYSKNNVLALYKILLCHSDEQHPMSMEKIHEEMDKTGHDCSDDSIYRYLKQLRYEFGVDIISTKGSKAGHYIGNRLLEKEELKLIVDAINASNFIEKTIASKMIAKLKETLSIHEADDLDQSIHGINVAKAENKKILYNVNIIQQALAAGVQISFDNLAWNSRKKLEKKNSRKNTLNPWALIWAGDRYYLYGYDIKAKDGVFAERHYRVDKMSDIQLLETHRQGQEQFLSFDASTYVSRRIGMFSGEESRITVKAPENMVGAFIDQFGTDIGITNDKNSKMVTISFVAVPSKLLIGWLIGLRRVEIVHPLSLREEMRELLHEVSKMYEERN